MIKSKIWRASYPWFTAAASTWWLSAPAGNNRAGLGGQRHSCAHLGVHSALTSFSFMNLLEGNPDYIMAIACTVSFAQVGVVLAMYLRTKDDTLKSLALPSFISGIFGVTEPAIYGVTLPRVKMFILSCIGGAVCGGFIMLTDTMMYSFSGLGVFAVLGLLSPENPNVPVAVLCAAVPFAASFAAALVLYKDEKADNASAPAETAPIFSGPVEIDSPIPGKVVPLTEVPDETFSTGVLGNGLAVEPAEGKVYAPFDGVCENLADTLHAVGLMSDTGISLLIHVGLETVGLDGKPFTPHIKTGERFKKGQLLLEFNMDEIRAAGCPTVTSVLVVNEDEVGEAKLVSGKILIGE